MTHILIVEDERSLSEPLAFLLEREGYRTTIA
jgi:two-component system response regulator RegX3